MVLGLVAFLVGCGGGGGTADRAGGPVAPAPVPDDPAIAATHVPKVAYLLDPRAGDPAVPAALGGPGFTGEGWTTRTETWAIGEAGAPQGGSLRTPIPDWPATLRFVGENGNTWVNFAAATLVGESLLRHDMVEYELGPSIASHWKISDDHQTYAFRIDPRARFQDGSPITADDVVATWRLAVSLGMRDPMSVLTYGKFEEPKAVSKYVVEVRAKEESWRNFLYFATMPIFQAKQIGTLGDTSEGFRVSGEAFLNRFQFDYPVMSGPYRVAPDDIKTGESITFTRDRKWWHEDDPTYDGWYNLETISFVVVKDQGLQFEKTKKGELDYFVVPKAQWWAEDIPALADVKTGVLGATRFFTEIPFGTSGMALNTTRPPLDDDRVRLALQHLYDRETFIDKLFFGQYEPLTSYFQGGSFANPDNPLLPYDEVAAVELLEQAGWTEKNAEGYRTKDGKELRFTVSYRTQLSERTLTLFQESCKRAGVRIDLELLNDSTAWKNLTERAFDIMEQAWTGLVVPNPETSWSSKLADQKDNNNVTAFRDAEVDALLAEYDREYDPQKRVATIRKIDALVYAQHPYILGWYNPAQRILYRNKFGMPKWGSARVAYGMSWSSIFELWWVDPEKEKALAAGGPLEPAPAELRFWPQWSKAHQLTSLDDASVEGR